MTVIGSIISQSKFSFRKSCLDTKNKGHLTMQSQSLAIGDGDFSHPAGPEPLNREWIERTAERLVGVVLSLCLLLFLAPVLLVIAAIIYCSDPGPIFFGHKRIGKDGRQFRCWKFRSMVVDADARLAALLQHDAAARFEWERDHKLRNDPRITKLGGFLRRTSLDELPQLINVLVGDMSLVGPRPIVLDEVKRYGHYFDSYCQARPGLTGLWQISGRNDLSYRRRVAIDVAYARAKSMKLDCYILFATVPRVLLAKGSY